MWKNTELCYEETTKEKLKLMWLQRTNTSETPYVLSHKTERNAIIYFLGFGKRSLRGTPKTSVIYYLILT